MSDNSDQAGAGRMVLAVGLPVESQDEDGLAPLGALDSLVEAPQHAALMSEVLQGFGYQEGSVGSLPESPGDDIRKAVTSASTSVLVVHIVAHGRLAEDGERELHVVGSDGKNLDDPVSAWMSLIESHRDKKRPLTLFLLDLCHSGAAATLSWHQRMRVNHRRAWVIAASGRDDKAFDYRLSRATHAVLHRYLDGKLRVDPSHAHIPLPTIAREIDRAVTKLNAAEGFDQQIEVSRVPMTACLDDLPFFPNPWHQVDTPVLPDVEVAVASLLDEAFDERHFMLRGAGSEALDRGLGRGYFRGRTREVRSLSGWLNGKGPGFGLLTGKPGSGKSALLGVLVSAAHPKLRDVAEALWFPLEVKPGRNDRLAVVHARRRNLSQIAASLARQMGAGGLDRPSGWDAEGLTKLARARSGRAHTLVVDALDEAERPADVAQALLLPLARAALEEEAGLRLLVGTRERPDFTALQSLAQEMSTLVNLDLGCVEELYEALRQYVVDLLAVDTGYSNVSAHDAAQALAEGIAARLTGVNDSTDARNGSRPLGWGEFLVAGLYVRAVLERPVERDAAAARELGLAVPLDLRALFQLDLARRDDQPQLLPVLSALAHAESLGMPERVIAHVAAAFAPTRQEAKPLPLGEVRAALTAARFYLRRDVDVDGTTLFRLFHEELSEQLRAEAYGSLENGRVS
ncbi:hypothetical protein ACFO9E_08110 [Streptomyces maoxianensis]|uniref:Nephrocystin 3-like N-terminal domain-containing protein n=1 Tax=Streptomyces maoxianensis TaxID=1459942 RepID=A0ABV9G3J3_9ACTN